MRLRGTFNWLAYNFACHDIGGVQLTWWLLGLTVGWIALLILGTIPRTPPGIAAAALALLLVLLFVTAKRSGYVIFRPAQAAAAPAPALKPEEKIPARATGFFEVSGMRAYFAGIQARFETVETREHIVIAQNAASRFLFFATTRTHERGLWYAFFQPAHLQRIETGTLCFGWRIQSALRIVFRDPEKKEEETLYLAFDDGEKRSVVLNDLRLDAGI